LRTVLPTIFSLPFIMAVAGPAVAQAPLAVPVDGEPFAARLTSVDAQGKLTFDGADKRPSLALADLISWGQPAELRKGPIFVLANGGYLPAALLGATKTEVSVDSNRLGTLKLPLDSLAGIIFRPPPHAAELDALLDRIARGQGQADRLVLDNGDEMTGLVETLEGDTIKIKGNLGLVEIAVRRVLAIIFNPALRQQPVAEAGAAWIGLNDGTRVQGTRLQLDADSSQWTTLSGAKWHAPAKGLVFLMPQASRAVYLSDIRPAEYRFVPYLETKWPYKLDRNVTGGQLRCGGRIYLKGIGMHSAARLGYKLDSPWRRFQAEVGIDDSTGGRGSVGFRVFVDGKQKYTSPPLRGRVPPQSVSVDLTGAKQLDLVVDFGEAGDVMDHADWLGARLVK